MKYFQKVREPDFFIVGAPKCGTTSLKAYLREHPEIFIPAGPPTEPHYFLPENHRKPLGESEYYALFRAAVGAKRAGEKSVWYLSASLVPQRIKCFCPRAKIIVMLRNPVDMLYSLHAQLLFSANENIVDFKQALDAEEDRWAGHRIPPGCFNPFQLYYREVANYAPQVKRYFDTFDRENVHVIIFDDFKNNTATVYRETLRFLGVDDSFTPDFKRHNQNTIARSGKLMYFRYNYPEFIRTIGRLLVPSVRLRHGLMQTLTKVNTKSLERPPMPQDLRLQLQQEFRRDVVRLSALLGRDLMHWVEE